MADPKDCEPERRIRHVFHGQALAVSGVITRPLKAIINVPASSTLSSDGGYQSARSGAFRLENIIQFDAAHTQVAGSEDPKTGSFTTMVSSVVENLSIFEVVRARRIVSQLAIYHDPKAGEISAYPLGSRFEDLYIGGRRIDVELDIETFTEHPTWSALRHHANHSRQLRPDLMRRWGWDGPEVMNGTRDNPSPKVILSLVRRASGYPRGEQTPAYQFCVPGFGTVYLAEYMIDRGSRRLNMLRVELGSPVDGRVTAGGAEGNGSLHPL